MFVGMRSLGWSVGSLEAISAARGAASGVYAIIDAVSNTMEAAWVDWVNYLSFRWNAVSVADMDWVIENKFANAMLSSIGEFTVYSGKV